MLLPPLLLCCLRSGIHAAAIISKGASRPHACTQPCQAQTPQQQLHQLKSSSRPDCPTSCSTAAQHPGSRTPLPLQPHWQYLQELLSTSTSCRQLPSPPLQHHKLELQAAKHTAQFYQVLPLHACRAAQVIADESKRPLVAMVTST